MGVDARSVSQSDPFPEIVGRSVTIQEVLELVKKISPSDSSVLIQGESGTGKELIATAIHRLSARASKPLVAINCSAIPETLLESELFGHERGAFTGADRKRNGYFAAASGGTIFLDEIGDMSLSLQSKLLRILQEKKYTPLGGDVSKSTDVRIIAATNNDLEKAVQKNGNFRLDLYYRLNVLPIYLPPLRERREDIEDLLQHFLLVYNRTYADRPPCYFHKETIACMTKYHWQGNVRQLQNIVNRMILTSTGGELLVAHLPSEIQVQQQISAMPQYAEVPDNFGQPGFKLNEHVEQLENKLILKALRSTGNNKNRAAKILGLNRTTLVEKIKKRRLSISNYS